MRCLGSCQLPHNHWHVCPCPFAQNSRVSFLVSPQLTPLTQGEVGKKAGQTQGRFVRGGWVVFFFFFSPSAPQLIATHTGDGYLVGESCALRSPLFQTGLKLLRHPAPAPSSVLSLPQHQAFIPFPSLIGPSATFWHFSFFLNSICVHTASV